jgi:hypothetical protein
MTQTGGALCVQRVRIFVSAAKSATAACQIDSLMSQSMRFFGRGLSSTFLWHLHLGTFLFVFERSAAKDRIYQQEVCASAAVSNKQKQDYSSFHCSTVPCPIPPLHHSVAHVGDELDKLRAFAFRFQSLVGIAEGKRGLLLSFGSSHIPRGKVKSSQSLHMTGL